jgi:hypothetical protein
MANNHFYNNSVASVHERTIPTERLPLVSKVSANSCGYRGVAWSGQIPMAVFLVFLLKKTVTEFEFMKFVEADRIKEVTATVLSFASELMKQET